MKEAVGLWGFGAVLRPTRLLGFLSRHPTGNDSTLTVKIGMPADGKKDLSAADTESGRDSPYTVDTTTGFFNQYSFA
jgi:hypothetical protein